MAPAIIGRLGPVRALFFAQTTYVLFAAANFLLECGYFLRGQLLLPAALGVGLTCSTLWAAQGMYVNNISQRYDALREGDGNSLGLFNGICSAAVTTGMLTGLSASSVLLRRSVDPRKLYAGLLALLAVGNALLLTLPAFRPVEKEEPKEREGVLASLVSVPALIWRSRPAKKIAVFNVSRGLSFAFATGAFATDAVAVSLGAEWVGYIMGLRNGASAVGAILLGGLSDRIGRASVFIGSAVAQACFFGFFCFSATVKPGGNLFAPLFALSALYGFSNGGTNSSTQALIPELFGSGGESKPSRWRRGASPPRLGAALDTFCRCSSAQTCGARRSWPPAHICWARRAVPSEAAMQWVFF